MSYKLIDSDTGENIIEKINRYEQEIERLTKSLEEQRHFYLEKLQQKENIIKQVREYVDKWENIARYKLLEMLDKENK